MGLFGGGPEKVVEHGARATGRIVAISVSETTKDDSTLRVDEYVVSLDGTDRRLAVRQVLDPDDRVRLGMPVHVRVRDDDLFIDWASTMSDAGLHGSNVTDRWKSIKDWGDRGVTDSTGGLGNAIKKGSPASLRLDRIDHVSQLGGLIRTITFVATVTIDGDEPYEVELKRQVVPHYASHLATVGRMLPAYVDNKRLDRVTIDWPSAAEREPGLGVAPSAEAIRVREAPSEAMSMGSIRDDGGWTPPPPSADFEPPPPIEGVSWETYLQVSVAIKRDGIQPKDWSRYAEQFGVPAGRWPKIDQAWGKQIARNVDLQRSFAAEMM